ncbi:hypothetical protein [Segniliparus rotundus]|nr:hypothetical protein [Segniliparus rotundus]
MSDTAIAILLAIKRICEDRQLELRHSYLTEAEYQEIDEALAELGYKESHGDTSEWEGALRAALFGRELAGKADPSRG